MTVEFLTYTLYPNLAIFSAICLFVIAKELQKLNKK